MLDARAGGVIVWLSLGAGACFEDPQQDEADSTGSETGGSTDTNSDSGADGDGPIPECADARLEITEMYGSMVRSSTDARPDGSTGSCGGDGSPDMAFEWVAPLSDYFRFHTLGSSFDTVLYLRDGCDGDEIACNNNAVGVASSEVIEHFDKGSRAIVVVDGNAGEYGEFALGVERVTCPAVDLTGRTFPIMNLTTEGGPDIHGGACGGAGHPEKAFRWTPPIDGLYRFRAHSGAFEPAVYLEDGPICGGTELACNGRGAMVTRALRSDRPVTIIVDGASGRGDFSLYVDLLGTACPEASIEEEVPVVGTFEMAESTLGTSCGDVDYSDGTDENVDRVYRWTWVPPEGATCECSLDVTSGQRVALALLEDSCGGQELMCANASVWDSSLLMYRSALTDLPAEQPGNYVVVIQQQYSPMTGGDSTFEAVVHCGCVA